MVTVTRNPDLYLVMPGEGYDGVVQVSAGGFYGSGVLLKGGRAVLTAAHVVDGAETITVRMDTFAGRINLPASQYVLHPYYDIANGNGDLSLIWLDAPAPVSAERSTIYRYNDDLGSDTTIVGYGLTGEGLTGYVDARSYCQIWCLRVLGHAAIWSVVVASIPSLNLTPVMTLAR